MKLLFLSCSLSSFPSLPSPLPTPSFSLSHSCLLSVAFFTAGFLNLNTCQSSSIPIYLIVAGMVVIAELAFQSGLCLWNKCHHTENPGRSTTHVFRRCDCIAFFLFVWLLFGSRWVFGMITNGNRGCTTMDDVVAPPPINTSASHPPSPSGTTESGCQDCSDGVYVFAVVTVLLQYLLCLILFLACIHSVLYHRCHVR